MQIITSSRFSLNKFDWLKSLAIAAFSAPVLIILTSFTESKFDINWTEMWHLAVSSGSGYLIQKFFSGPKTTITPPITDPGTSITSNKN